MGIVLFVGVGIVLGGVEENCLVWFELLGVWVEVKCFVYCGDWCEVV